ncbi:helix-turn-helix domain-containing protein [Micromonospora sp. NPDC126480]|uniref:helix-turn-helix transcriptional regulator n=1 Tax=Micromonospora sp. NPDC126480 TaxID=3155312 RepID=UPI0033184464
MDQSPVVLRPHETLVERVKQLRKARGWSAQRLADEMAKVGVPWERMIVTKLENGRRAGVSVEEMLALAYVLDVAPVHLLIPPVASSGEERFYAMVPNVGMPLRDVREWVRGKEPAAGQDPRPYFSEVPPEERDGAQWSAADVAAESARIQYHRKNGDRLRSGEIDSDTYWTGVVEAERAARAAVESGRGDG